MARELLYKEINQMISPLNELSYMSVDRNSTLVNHETPKYNTSSGKLRFSQLLLRYIDKITVEQFEFFKKSLDLGDLVTLTDELIDPFGIYFDQNLNDKGLLPEVNNIVGHNQLIDDFLKTNKKWVNNGPDAKVAAKNNAINLSKLTTGAKKWGWKSGSSGENIKKINKNITWDQSHLQELVDLLQEAIWTAFMKSDRDDEGLAITLEPYVIFINRLSNLAIAKKSKLSFSKKLLSEISQKLGKRLITSDPEKRFRGTIFGVRLQLNHLFLKANVEPIEVIPKPEEVIENLIESIFTEQFIIIENWHTALDNFDRVMQAPPSKEAETDFNGVFLNYIVDKLKATATNFVKHLPGGEAATNIIEFGKKLNAESARAAKVKTQIQLRDFYVSFRTWIGNSKTSLAKDRQLVKTKTKVEYSAIKVQKGAVTNDIDLLKARYLNNLYKSKKASEKDTAVSSSRSLEISLTVKWISGHKSGNIYVFTDKNWQIKEAQVRSPRGAQISDIYNRLQVDPFQLGLPKMVTADAVTSQYPARWWSDAQKPDAVWLRSNNDYWDGVQKIHIELRGKNFRLGIPAKWKDYKD